MRRTSWVTAIALAGTAFGCATPPAPADVGNFGGLTPDIELRIADETAAQMRKMYEPSKSRLNLRQPTPDAFGVALVARLRDNGYAVSEYAGPGPAMGTENWDRKTRDEKADAGTDLRYIIDHPDPDLYRVTVFVSTQSISRAYTMNRGELTAFGAWVRKE